MTGKLILFLFLDNSRLFYLGLGELLPLLIGISLKIFQILFQMQKLEEQVYA